MMNGKFREITLTSKDQLIGYTVSNTLITDDGFNLVSRYDLYKRNSQPQENRTAT